jgi:hypothetical protein
LICAGWFFFSQQVNNGVMLVHVFNPLPRCQSRQMRAGVFVAVMIGVPEGRFDTIGLESPTGNCTGCCALLFVETTPAKVGVLSFVAMSGGLQVRHPTNSPFPLAPAAFKSASSEKHRLMYWPPVHVTPADGMPLIV